MFPGMNVNEGFSFSAGQAVVWLPHSGRFEILARVLKSTPKRVRIRAIREYMSTDPFETTVNPRWLREPTPREQERIDALLPWP
jgi:hypothetical protein